MIVDDALRHFTAGEELRHDRETLQTELAGIGQGACEDDVERWLLNFHRRDKMRLLELAIVANHSAARATALLAAVESLYSGETRAAVVAAIEDIVLNLIGAERFTIVESGSFPELVNEAGPMTVHVPLRLGGRVAGMIVIEGSGEFTALDFELFDVLSRHAAVALLHRQ